MSQNDSTNPALLPQSRNSSLPNNGSGNDEPSTNTINGSSQAAVMDPCIIDASPPQEVEVDTLLASVAIRQTALQAKVQSLKEKR